MTTPRSDHPGGLELAEPFTNEGRVPASSVILAPRLEIALGVGRRDGGAAGSEQRHSQRQPHDERGHDGATLGAGSAACQAAVCSLPRISGGPTMAERSGGEDRKSVV